MSAEIQEWDDPHTKYEAPTNPAAPDAKAVNGEEVGNPDKNRNNLEDRDTASKKEVTTPTPEEMASSLRVAREIGEDPIGQSGTQNPEVRVAANDNLDTRLRETFP